ncbi:MAG: adenylosuccinate synthetase, partial [Methanomassiliicoccaceae archaeon]|nr:adenylosuccinate synthetase [Methanomassiliicoccaceae archaeon]
RPVYRTMKGWEGWDDTAAVVKGGYDALPEEMRAYISFIEGFLKVPVDIISIGPDREDTIDRNTDWWG